MSKAICDSTDDRIDYLRRYGWEAAAESEVVREVILPSATDKVFDEFNRIQKVQGYNLVPLSGKRVMRCTYKLLNFPGYENCGEIYAEIYIYKGRIVASDIFSVALNGFMVPVKSSPNGDQNK